MKYEKYIKLIFLPFIFVYTTSGFALAIRSFVVMPVEKNGVILRTLDFNNFQTGNNTLTGDFAYGIANRHALILEYPTNISAMNGSQNCNLAALYRYTVFQQDEKNSTARLGLIGGGVIPTIDSVNGGLKGGLVASFFKGRNELDSDLLYTGNFASTKDNGQYDISWQYRIYPNQYAEWGLGSSLNTVLEYNGRWIEGANIAHQTTIGLQWVSSQLILETGIVQVLNSTHATIAIIGARIHI